MKKTLFTGIGLLSAALLLLAFSIPFELNTPSNDDLELGFPEDVHQVLETSCFDCHTAGSKNEDAKKELNFSGWNDYEDAKKIGKLDKMCELVQEGKMPTKKYLEYYPDRALSEEQVTLLCNWTEEEGNNLMGE